MPVESQDKQLLTKDAFLAFNQIGGDIQRRSLAILRRLMGEKETPVADRDLVQEAYWEACQEVLGHKVCG